MFPIFTKLGGDEATFRIIARRRGMRGAATWRPSRMTTYRWRINGRLPGPIQTALAEECAERGIACSFDDMRWVHDADTTSSVAA